MDSNSWFSSIKKLLIQYDLPQIDILLYEMPSKYVWSRKVKEGIDTHWRNRILCDADLYSSLQYMDTTMFKRGTLHPIVDIDSPSSRNVTRLAVKLKMITGTYLLQSNRASFNQTAVDPRCLLCGKEPETLGRLLLRCEVLDSTRRPLYAELCSVAEEQFHCVLEDLSDSEQLQVILNVLVSSTTKRSVLCSNIIQEDTVLPYILIIMNAYVSSLYENVMDSSALLCTYFLCK